MRQLDDPNTVNYPTVFAQSVPIHGSKLEQIVWCCATPHTANGIEPSLPHTSEDVLFLCNLGLQFFHRASCTLKEKNWSPTSTRVYQWKGREDINSKVVVICCQV